MKKIKVIKILFIFIIFIGVAIYFTKMMIKDHTIQLFGELIYRVETQEKVVALTFDDGPKAKRTEKILDILQQQDIKATFFLNGKQLKKNPVQAKALINSGHQIANHSYSHKRMVFMSYSEVKEEIESTTKIIRDYGYQGDLHFRPPYGNTLVNLPLYLANNSIKTITWDVEPETWGENRADSQEQVKRALEQTKPGSIIITHVMHGDEESINAVPIIIEKLKKQGYRFVTIDELLSMKS